MLDMILDIVRHLALPHSGEWRGMRSRFFYAAPPQSAATMRTARGQLGHRIAQLKHSVEASRDVKTQSLGH